MQPKLSDERLAEIRALRTGIVWPKWSAGREDMQSYDGATGEPFSSVYADDDRAGAHLGERLPLRIATIPGEKIEQHEEKAIARFIASSPEMVDDLLAEIDRLRLAVELGGK